MDGIKLNALCVKAVDYKDNRTLLTLCTVEKGKINAAIRGAKSEKSKLRFAASLLCFGEYVLAEKNGFYTVTNCTLIDGFYDVRRELDKFYAAFAVIEALDKLTEPNTDISDYIIPAINALKEINYGREPYLNLLAYLVESLRLAGYSFNLSVCMSCGDKAYPPYFDISLGGGVCLKCKSPESLELSHCGFSLLRRVLDGIDARGVSEKLSADDFSRADSLDALAALFQYFSVYAEIRINALTEILKRRD